MAGGLIMSNSPELLGYYPYLFCGGIVSGFGGIFGLSYFDYNVRTNKIRNLETNKEIEAYYSENSLPRQLSYYAIVGGMTMLVSPILVFANAQNILMPSMFITGAIFSGATLYANTRKVDELEAWSYGLHSGVFALVGCGFTGLASTLIFGENTFSIFLHSINVYAGIPIFAGLIAFNTHKAIKMYKNKDPDHLVCSVELYLDFMNILIRIIEIMQKFQKKD
jgi:FtsH-binding integral membrane protein